MCTSRRPPKVEPVASAPVVAPVSVDETVVEERDRERRRNRTRSGRSSTILAGATGAGQPPTAPAKTALGA